MKSNTVERDGLLFECIGYNHAQRRMLVRGGGEPETYTGYLLWNKLPGTGRADGCHHLIYKPLCPKGFIVQLSFINYTYLLT